MSISIKCDACGVRYAKPKTAYRVMGQRAGYVKGIAESEYCRADLCSSCVALLGQRIKGVVDRFVRKGGKR